MKIINSLITRNVNTFLVIKQVTLTISIVCFVIVPFYALKDKCGGNFKYTDKGIKDCSKCTLPHRRDNYDYIMGKFKDIINITKKDD